MASRATNVWTLCAALAVSALGSGCAGFGLSKSSSATPLGANPPPKPSLFARMTSWISPDPAKEADTGPGRIDPVHDSALSMSKKSRTGPDLNVAMARVLQNNGKMNEAVEQYKKALQIDGNYLPALEGLGQLEDHENHLEAATEWYKRASEVAPKEARLYNDLGLCMHRRGMLPESVQQYRQAIALQPDRALYRNNLAVVLVEMNQPAEALQQLIAANGASLGHYNLGYLMLRKGDRAGAELQFRTAVAIDPSLEAAKVWIAKLQPAGAPAAVVAQASPAGAASPASGQPPQATAPPVAQFADRRTAAPGSPEAMGQPGASALAAPPSGADLLPGGNSAPGVASPDGASSPAAATSPAGAEPRATNDAANALVTTDALPPRADAPTTSLLQPIVPSADSGPDSPGDDSPDASISDQAPTTDGTPSTAGSPAAAAMAPPVGAPAAPAAGANMPQQPAQQQPGAGTPSAGYDDASGPQLGPSARRLYSPPAR